MTQKDTAMNWDQIETKWTAMTRRIRADLTAHRIETTSVSGLGRKTRDVITATIAENRTIASKDPEFKSSAK